MGIPLVREKLAILGGNPGMGVGNGIGHDVDGEMMKSYYPGMIARSATGAAVSHFEEAYYFDPDYNRAEREGSSRPSHFPAMRSSSIWCAEHSELTGRMPYYRELHRPQGRDMSQGGNTGNSL